MMVITLFPIWWPVTRWIGIAAYSGTSLYCVLTWLKARRHHPPSGFGVARLASSLAMIEFLLALDMIFEWRIALHNFGAGLFMKYNLYNQRQPIQIALLFILGCVLLFALGRACRLFHARGGSLLAVSGLSMSLTLWLMEIISLHQTDSGLYHLVNDVMVIAFLWVLACSLTLLGVGIEARFAAHES
jgi:hypothetical protein